MKIAIISDSHDNRRLFREAAMNAKKQGAEALVHCGDIVAPSTLKEACHSGLPIHAIYGNNAGDLVMMHRVAAKPENKINFYGMDAGIRLHDRRIFVVHYPHYARAMAVTGEYDVVCYGHDHHYHEEQINNMEGTSTLLLNPGSVAGLDGPASYMILDLESMQVEKQLLEH